MTEKQCQLTDKLRNYVYRYGVELSDENLKKMGLSKQEIDENFSGMEEVAKLIFEQERIAFEKIFEEYNFDGWNAIDILLLVSNEINNRFFDVSPSVSYKLAKAFPAIFEEHRNQRSVAEFRLRFRRIPLLCPRLLARGLRPRRRRSDDFRQLRRTHPRIQQRRGI